MSHIVYLYNATIGPNGTDLDLNSVAPSSSYHASTKSLLADGLEKYYSLFLVCFGTIGNGLSLAVLSRKTFRSSPIGIYLRWLAMSDLSALYTGCVYFSAKALFNYDIRGASPYSCRFHRWFSYASVDMSSWILILVTTARLISILYPLRTVCTRVVAYISLFLTLAAALAANLPMFLFYGRMKQYSTGPPVCKYFPEYRFFVKNVWQWIVTVKFAVIPVCILIILNTILCIRVFRSSNDMKRLNNNSYRDNKSYKKGNSSRIRNLVNRLSGKRVTNHYDGNSPYNLTISNTDITRMTTTGDMATSLLQSSEENCRRSALNSRYASTEELKKELNERYGCGTDLDKTLLESPNPNLNTLTSTEKDNNKKQGNALIRFAKHVFNNKIRNKKSKYLFSTPNDDNNATDDDSLKQTRPLSTASDGVMFERSRNSTRSLCYDSRNSFHFARDSLQYTKEKRKRTSSKQEEEGLIRDKNAEETINCLDDNTVYQTNQNNSQSNKNDFVRPTPIFTISSAGGHSPSNQNVIFPDLDSSVDNASDVNFGSNTDISKSRISIQENCNDNNHLSEHSDYEMDETTNADHLSLQTRKDYRHQMIQPNKNKDKRKPPILNHNNTDGDVANNLRAASIKLRYLSLNPDTESHSDIPLKIIHKRNHSDNNYDSHEPQEQQDDAGSDSSRRSTTLLANGSTNPSNLLPGKENSPGRISPSFVSNGLLTPGGRNSQMTCSRNSLNVAIVRGRTGAGKAKSRNLTVTLLVINLVFIICNIPIVVYMTIRSYVFKERGVDSPGYNMEIVSNFTMYTNNATNFILYCLTGTRFRVELKAMLREALDLVCGRRRRRRRLTMR